MDFNEYQGLALQTSIYRDKIRAYVDSLEIPDIQKSVELINMLCLAYSVLGLAGEAGELANKLKKVLRDQGGELTREVKQELAKENGDVTWYNSAVFSEVGMNYEVGAIQNINKLLNRKENGTIGGSGDNR